MVSLKKYCEIFVQIFPERIREFRRLRDTKRNIDDQIEKQPNKWEKNRPVLLDILGKSTLFSSAERKKKRSMRHHAYKLIKSLAVFNKNKDRIRKAFWGVYSYNFHGEKISQFLSELKFNEYLEQALIYSNEFEELLRNLDEIYESEANAIESGDYSGYLRLVRSEKDIEKRIVVGEDRWNKTRQSFAERISTLNYLLTGKAEDISTVCFGVGF